MRPLNVLTWHVHGSYLHYLSHAPHRFLLPVGVEHGRPGYGGRAGTFPWRDNVIEVPIDRIAETPIDVVLCQTHENWLADRALILTPAQRDLPTILLEHDPPRALPTDTPHPVRDDRALVVHVTHFNALMWDNGDAETCVIEHGVPDRGARWRGDRRRGLTVVNGLARRGRRLGSDVFARAASQLPIDLVGMHAEEAGGLGEIAPPDLLDVAATYRFFFHPIRWTSLGLALCEAMMMGMPVVGLATTELPTIIRNGENGFIHADEAALHEAMRTLLDDHALAQRIGAAGRETALQRFSIERFAKDWSAAFERALERGRRMAA